MRWPTLILPALAALAPDIPVVAEEAVAAGRIPEVAARFWLVDRLTAPEEFVRRSGEFTINIALVEEGVAVLGAVFAPALGCPFAGAVGYGAFIEDREGGGPSPAALIDEGLTVWRRSHGDAARSMPFSPGQGG